VLQCVALCRRMLQRVLQCVAVCCSVLQCVAVRCGGKQRVAAYCSALQCVTVCCSVYIRDLISQEPYIPLFVCDMTHSNDLCCSVLQCVAVRYSMLQCIYKGPHITRAPHPTICVSYDSFESPVLQRIAVRCSALQCVAVYISGTSYHKSPTSHHLRVT